MLIKWLAYLVFGAASSIILSLFVFTKVIDAHAVNPTSDALTQESGHIVSTDIQRDVPPSQVASKRLFELSAMADSEQNKVNIGIKDLGVVPVCPPSSVVPTVSFSKEFQEIPEIDYHAEIGRSIQMCLDVSDTSTDFSCQAHKKVKANDWGQSEMLGEGTGCSVQVPFKPGYWYKISSGGLVFEDCLDQSCNSSQSGAIIRFEALPVRYAVEDTLLFTYKDRVISLDFSQEGY